jgi:cobalamin synthase
MGRPSAVGIAAAVVVVAVGAGGVIYGYGGQGIVFAALSFLIAAAVPHLLSKRFGGVTGDVMGASVLVTETLLFVMFALGL